MTIHFLGLAGSNMLGIAQLALAAGHEITGSDQRDARPRIGVHPGLRAVWHGYDAAHVSDQALVVTSSLVAEDNPELAEAQRLGIPVWSRGRMMAQLIARKRRTFAVSGSFGKSSVGAMLVAVLAARAPGLTYVIGEKTDAGTPCAAWGEGDEAVVEACEFGNELLHLAASDVIVTNVCENHASFFGSGRQRAVRTFRAFANIHAAARQIVVNMADPGSCEAGLPALSNAVTFGMREADWHVEPLGRSAGGRWQYRPFRLGRALDPFTMHWGGPRSSENAAAVIAAATGADMPLEDVLAALAGARPLPRRMQILQGTEALVVVDDHARSPLQIGETLSFMRASWPGRKFAVVVGPWSKLDPTDPIILAEALSSADRVGVLSSATHERRNGGIEANEADRNLVRELSSRGVGAGVLDSLASHRDFARACLGGPTLCAYLGFDDFLPAARAVIAQLEGTAGHQLRPVSA